MSDSQVKLLFVGAGNIAQSIIKGIRRGSPNLCQHILVTAPTSRNLESIEKVLGCKTVLLANASTKVDKYQPTHVCLCVKPQVLMASIISQKGDKLAALLRGLPSRTILLSVIAGVKSEVIASFLNRPCKDVVRFMVNTAAELRLTSVFYHAHPDIDDSSMKGIWDFFQLISPIVSKLTDEQLMDVATGICGSGIAFIYEVIQAISDIAVKNGLPRSDATRAAAQLTRSAGEMFLTKRVHPYQLRDEVMSPAGTTIFGISAWHDNSTSECIARSFQASIDRAKQLSAISEAKFKDL